jgi:hypothetical protein
LILKQDPLIEHKIGICTAVVISFILLLGNVLSSNAKQSFLVKALVGETSSRGISYVTRIRRNGALSAQEPMARPFAAVVAEVATAAAARSSAFHLKSAARA